MWCRCDHPWWPEAHEFAPHKVLILTPDMNTFEEITLDRLQKILGPGLVTLSAKAHRYEYKPTSTTIKAMSTSMEEVNMQGRDYDVIGCDELDQHPRKFSEVLARCVGTRWRGTVLVAATRKTIRWFDDRYVNNADLDIYALTGGRSDDNIHLNQEATEQWKASMTEAEYRMKFLGELGSYEGNVYDRYNPEVHRRPASEFAEWLEANDGNIRRFRSIDPGYSPTTPTAAGWYAATFNPPKVWRYREYYHASSDLEAHVDAIRELSGDEKYEMTIFDPNSEMLFNQFRRHFPGEPWTIKTRDKGRRTPDNIAMLQKAIAWDGELHAITREPILSIVDGAHVEFENEALNLTWSPHNDARVARKQPDHATEEARRLFTTYPMLVLPRLADPARIEKTREPWEVPERFRRVLAGKGNITDSQYGGPR